MSLHISEWTTVIYYHLQNDGFPYLLKRAHKNSIIFCNCRILDLFCHFSVLFSRINHLAFSWFNIISQKKSNYHLFFSYEIGIQWWYYSFVCKYFRYCYPFLSLSMQMNNYISNRPVSTSSQYVNFVVYASRTEKRLLLECNITM